MPVEAACPSCAGKFRLPDAAAGKKIRCPKCKGPLDVPSLTVEAAPQTAVVPPAPIPSAPVAALPAPTVTPAAVVPQVAEGLKSTWRSAPQDPAPPEPPKKEVRVAETAPREEPKPVLNVAVNATTKAASSRPPPSPVRGSTPKPAVTAPVFTPPPSLNPPVKPKAPEPQPAKVTPPPAPIVAPAISQAPPPERWFLKGEDGETFGPVDRATLNLWHGEGRMTADSQLLRDGTEQWQWASDLFPDLEEPATPAEPPPSRMVAKSTGESSIHPATTSGIGSKSNSVSGKAKSKPRAVDPDDDEADDADGEEQLSPHSKPVAFLLALTLGMFGIHRFYLGYVGIGLAMFFTFGGLLMWSITDALRILFGHVTDSEGKKLRD